MDLKDNNIDDRHTNASNILGTGYPKEASGRKTY